MEWAALVLVSLGVFFLWAGTVGMLRFPDIYTRLHGMTKADNLGVGFVVVGLLFIAPGLQERGKLLLIWVFLLVAATTAAHLVAMAALEEDDGADF